MHRPLLLLFGAVSTFLSYGQAARLVLNNTAATAGQHPYIVFNPAANAGTYLVVDNPATTGITQLGVVTAPVIKSEREENKIRWATGATTGAYVIPFSTASNVAMPLTVNKTSAGAGAGSLILSTYNSQSVGLAVNAGWDNSAYLPSDVTHIFDMPSGSVNNSANAIDRFWIIDAGEGAYAYTTKPGVTLTFGFDPAEAAINGTPGNNPSLNGNLVAQRFNSSINKWYDIPVMGSQMGNTVGGVSPSPADFFRSWTLSNTLLPLPVQLVEWNADCDGGNVVLKWTTASEQDNLYFTIEKSRNAQEWTAIGAVPGAVNSSYMISYSFTDDDAQGLAYYRLRQTDINGSSTVSSTIAAGCGKDGGTAIVNAWDDGSDLNVVVSSTADGVYDLILMDAQGKILSIHPTQTVGTGFTTLRVDKRNIATGIYVIQLLNNAHMMARRVHVH
ncbi:MAG TPA: hypothetical protein PKD45_06110 [Flavobacteriales bacterium]|nr:hypothetical protein [Flavobacteriales bacterium]